MRRLVALAALVVAVAVAGGAPPAHARPRRPPRHPPATLPPAAQVASEARVAALRAPGADMILVRAGAFAMGSDALQIRRAIALCNQEFPSEDCDERRAYAFEYHGPTPRKVYVSDFWIDRTEVTVARYRLCVAAGRCREPGYAEGGARFDRPELPVVLVSWFDARAFCAWAGGRLPTEAEWERAARGLAGREYPWGNVYNPLLANHGRGVADRLDDRDGFLELAPVASFPDGRTPDGIYDLSGNVQEWVADWFGEYPDTDRVNPLGPAQGNLRVVRGGGYRDARTRTRGAFRTAASAATRSTTVGFRCVRPGTGGPPQ